MKRTLIIAGIAVAHYLLTFSTFLITFDMGIEEFHSGAPPSSAVRTLDWEVAVLHFPVVPAMERLMPRGWLPGL